MDCSSSRTPMQSLFQAASTAPIGPYLKADQSGFPIRHDKAVGIVAAFTPGKFIKWTAGNKRYFDRHELDPNANGGAAPCQVARDQKFIVTEAAIRCLRVMLGG